jgi:PAS domain S-box-containing protein
MRKPSHGPRAPAAVQATADRESARRARYLRLAFEHDLAHMALLDRDFNFLEVNATYARGCGHTRAELLGHNHFDVFPSDAKSIFEEVVRTGIPYVARARPFEYADQPERGITYWDWVLLPIVDAGGEVEALFFSLNDVTQQERARMALAAQEASYRTLAENSPDLIARFDRDGRHLYVNRAVEAAAGRSADAILGHTDEQLGVPDDRRERWATALRHVFATGERCAVDMAFDTVSGRRTYQCVIVPEYGPDGRVETALSISRDVTDLLRAEAARQHAWESLERMESRFRSLIENSTDIVVILDADGTLRYASPSVVRIMGRSVESVVGTNTLKRMHPEDRPLVEAAIAQAVEDPTAHPQVRHRYRHGDGTWHTFEGTVTNLLADPAVGGIVMNTRDITERVELQERYLQSQKLEVMGKLAGGVAHDFNNLLTVIRSSVEFLLDDLGAHDPRRSDVQTIATAAEQASRLTRQLLAFSRRQVLHPTLLDVTAVVTEMGRMLRRLIGEDIRLEIATEDAGAPALVRVDPGQLEQVIVNLCVNARDAMPGGGEIIIRVACTRESPRCVAHGTVTDGRSWVLLEVRDTGVGMTPEVQRMVFEPFFTTKASGTGLGLATVYGIVQQSLGHVGLESAPGHGTSVRIYLPLATGEVIAPDGAASDGALPRARDGETVLVVEDESAVRTAARKVLQRLGYRVLEAADGAVGLRIAATPDPRVDLVLTDIAMPGMNGLELAGALHGVRPEVAVIYMSGNPEELASRGMAPPAGAPVLQKPFTVDQVARTVRLALDTRTEVTAIAGT